MDLKKPFKLDGIYRIDDTPVHVAVREVLANCLVNADYFLDDCVKVEKYPYQLVFSNPGTIRLGKKQMLHGGKSSPRNKVIMNMFNFIGVGERAGSGVPNVYKIWQDENYEEPTVDEMSGRECTICTVVNLPLVEKSSISDTEKSPEKSPENNLKQIHNDKLEQRILLVLGLIKRNPSITRSEISASLKITDSQVRTALGKLKERGIIYRVGSDTKGEWRVN